MNRHLGKKSPSGFDKRLLFAGVFLLAGIIFFIFLFRLLFGGSGSDSEKNSESQDSEVPQSLSAAAEFLQGESPNIVETSVYGLSGHSVSGIAQRSITFAEYRVNIVASLPAIDGSVERYEAWALQPDLAGYFSLGSFEIRADGYHALTFDEPLINIAPYPEQYGRILITRETLADDNIPSNIRIAESVF